MVNDIALATIQIQKNGKHGQIETKTTGLHHEISVVHMLVCLGQIHNGAGHVEAFGFGVFGKKTCFPSRVFRRPSDGRVKVSPVIVNFPVPKHVLKNTSEKADDAEKEANRPIPPSGLSKRAMASTAACTGNSPITKTAMKKCEGASLRHHH